MWDKFKQAWDENPVAVLAAGGLTITAVAKLIDSFSAARGRNAYARQVDYKLRRKG
jgi:hypothetical protein